MRKPCVRQLERIMSMTDARAALIPACRALQNLRDLVSECGADRATTEWQDEAHAALAALAAVLDAAPREATDEEFRASARRMMTKHRPSLERLAALDAAPQETKE